MWEGIRGTSMYKDIDAVVHLGDDPIYRPIWSINGKLPSFRKSMGMLYHPYSDTVLTGREKMLAMGWPVFLSFCYPNFCDRLTVTCV